MIHRDPPVNKIFNALRQKWRKQVEGRQYQQLAKALSEYLEIKVTPQKLSQWATGSDNRKPPWAAIYWLSDETGYDVKLTPTEAVLQRRRTAAAWSQTGEKKK